MTTFSPVNTTSLAPDLPSTRHEGETTPTTPRPNTAPNTQPARIHRDEATTPTRSSFAGALASQRPLPASPFPSTIAILEEERGPVRETVRQNPPRAGAQYPPKPREVGDIEMGGDSEEGEEASDDESVNADGSKSSKKKKSQRFYCTDYPPCSLSFTRSEHLARHIRKHTGERPFQCHCSRRFSRLDNLRQHAQTVHLNEEIPQDSLAATGTRFQRQVRTDRVRPPGSRARASTTSSQTSQGRGHTRNSLSASSIGSVASVYSQREDVRRRPPPLVMAGESRARFAPDPYRPESPSTQFQYRTHSPPPGGFGTPTSATFPPSQNSPRWPGPSGGLGSPLSAHSRTASLYAGHRTPGRRLSVPSAGNPFQSPPSSSFAPGLLTPLSSSGIGSFSPSSSTIASPTISSSGSAWSRRESVSGVADDAWRRRTWHPDTSSGFTSRLQVMTTPNSYSDGPHPQPPVVPSNAPPLSQQPMRLPGIESFVTLPQSAAPPRSTTPIRRQPSPMIIDTPSRAPLRNEPYQGERPSSQYSDTGINRHLNRLEIAQGPQAPFADVASSWASEATRAVQARAEQVAAHPAVRFEESPYSAQALSSGSWGQHASAPPLTPKSNKRHGWYHGPVTVQNGLSVQRTSPADSSSSEGGGVPGTPGSSQIGDLNPGIVHANGWVEDRNNKGPTAHQDASLPQYSSQTPYPRPGGADAAYTYAPGDHHGSVQQQHQVPKSTDSNMLRLEALVAVATSEENVTAPIY